MEKYLQMEELMPLIRERLAGGQNVKFTPQGISMLPMLRPGRDSVLLAPVPEKLKRYDVVLYQRADSKYVLHRIVDVGDSYTCMGDNQFTPETGLHKAQMIAVVTAFFRDERKYGVLAPGYRLYCRFWHYSRPVRWLWRKCAGRLWRHLQ